MHVRAKAGSEPDIENAAYAVRVDQGSCHTGPAGHAPQEPIMVTDLACASVAEISPPDLVTRGGDVARRASARGESASFTR
jgi:hypothetical protein